MGEGCVSPTMGAAGSVNQGVNGNGRRVTCNACHQHLMVPDGVRGHVQIGCPRCGNIVVQSSQGNAPRLQPTPPTLQQLQANSHRGQAAGGGTQVVGCPHCRRHLIPPPGAPRFRCPCGRVLEMQVGHNYLLHAAQQPAQQTPQTTLVRCPRCSLLLRAPPGAPQFRCPCGILLALQGGRQGEGQIASWQCHLCSHKNSAGIGACVMCGAQKQIGVNKSDSAADAFRLRRANQLRKSKRQWKRQRGNDGTYTWVRQMDEEEVDIDIGAIELESASELKKLSVAELRARLDAMGFDGTTCVEKLDLVERLSQAHSDVEDLSVQELKRRLDTLCVNHSHCVEKVDLIRLLKRESTKRGKLSLKLTGDDEDAADAGWVRQIGVDGTISLVPASGQKVHSGHSLSENEDDVEGAAALPFEHKVRYMNLFLQHKIKIPREQGVVKIQIRRNAILDDAFNYVSSMKKDAFRRAFMFEFVGEAGLDYGGVSREFYTLLFEELFNVDFGLFLYSEVSNLAFSINPNSGVANEAHLRYFHFAGRMLAKAIFDGFNCPHHLCLPFYKHIIGFPIDMSDVEYVDPVLGKTLGQVVTIEDESVAELCLDFTATVTSFGATAIHPLKPNGENIEVTPANRHEYVKLMTKFMLVDRISQQLGMFLKGFYEVIPQYLISIFDFQELELLTSGLPNIDIVDWKASTKYKGAYASKGAKHQVTIWFWKAVDEYSQEQRARLLQFVTGTSRLPVQGFKGLQGNDGTLRPFTIDSIELKKAKFPRAHTCFNRIDLPLYESEGDLRQCLDSAIQMECFGFSMQ